MDRPDAGQAEGAGLAIHDREAGVRIAHGPELAGRHRDSAEDARPGHVRRRGQRDRRRLDDHRFETGMDGGRTEGDPDRAGIHQPLHGDVVGRHPGHRSVAADLAA